MRRTSHIRIFSNEWTHTQGTVLLVMLLVAEEEQIRMSAVIKANLADELFNLKGRYQKRFACFWCFKGAMHTFKNLDKLPDVLDL